MAVVAVIVASLTTPHRTTEISFDSAIIVVITMMIVIIIIISRT
ncbi:hypothetical protein ACQKIC_10465 [Peribacillus sp. NPDC046944]